MQKRFLNKLMMQKTVLTFFAENQSAWQSIPLIASNLDELKQLIREIELIEKHTGNKHTFVPQEKDSEQKKLIFMIRMVSSALLAVADRINNLELKNKIDRKTSHLENLKDNEKVTTARLVAELANTHLNKLLSTELSQQIVRVLEDQIADYESLLPLKQSPVAGLKATNAQLKRVFRQADRLLKQELDQIMVRYETEDPAFYAAYQNARMVMDYGAYHTRASTKEMISIPQ